MLFITEKNPYKIIVEGGQGIYNVCMLKRRFDMEENLIYRVGETLLLELDGALDIKYPKNIEAPEKLTLITDIGNYEITVKKIY